MARKNTSGTQIQSHFAKAVHADIKRSIFNRNSSLKTTFNCGDLVPVYLDEVLPGDTFEMDLSFVSRLRTPLFPTMDVLNLEFFAFFVPNRLVWDGWEELMGENKTSAWTPSNPPALVPQYTSVANISSRTIGDYYGLPLGATVVNMGGLSVLPFRGYGLIWNEFFRDQNTQAPLIIRKDNTDSGGNRYGILSPLLKVNKKHDYFTSCLPAPQKGESALIPIELNQLLPVITGALQGLPSNPVPLRMTQANGIVNNDNLAVSPFHASGDGAVVGVGIGQDITQNPFYFPRNLWADGRGMAINGTTISELRTAFQIQKLYERDARGGTRYVEMLKAHFGVDAQDYRLQRPEFLGSMHSYVGMQQVAQSSATGSGETPQGNVSAFSYTADRKILFKKSFTEHGYLHIFAVARHPKTYQQGVEKHFSRRERLDFYHPVFAHISEQPVLNKEIYVDDDLTANNEVFGYNEAWAEYRYKPNQVTGQMRDGVDGSIANFHYADVYPSRPYLSAEWMTDNSQQNVERTLATIGDLSDQIMMDLAFRCKATRPMPVHSIPGLVDHY